MTHEARPPPSRRLLLRAMPAVFRVVNVPMRFILTLPIATPLGKRLMLVLLDRVDSLRGRFAVDSPPRGGTRISIELPLEPMVAP